MRKMEIRDSKISHLEKLKFWNCFISPNNVMIFVLGIELLKCTYFVMFQDYRDLDYSSYYDQARIYLEGEKNYSELYGTQGPISYPALHLYTYALIAMISKDPLNPTPAII